MKHSLKERVKGSLVRPLGFRVATGLSPTFKIPLIKSVSSVPSGLVSTFTRGSIGTYIDDSRLLQTAASDIIRFQNGRYLVEPAATNLFLQSGDFSLDVTDIDNLVSDPVHGGPFSNVNSNLIELTSGTQYVFKTIALTAGTYCFSQYVKLGTSSSVGYGIYSVTTASWVSTQTKYTELSTDFFTRVFNTFTLASNQTVRIYVKRYIDATSLGTSYHFGGQVELGTVPTSHIPTTTVTVTRAADVLNYDVSSAITQGRGSLYCEFWNGNIPGAIRRLLNISDGTNNNRIYLYVNTTGKVSVIVVSGGVTQTSLPAYAILSTLNKALLTYKDNEIILYCNGTKRGEDLICTVPINFTKLSAGCSQDGTLQLNSGLGNIKYFKEVLTPEEAIKLTTL